MVESAYAELMRAASTPGSIASTTHRSTTLPKRCCLRLPKVPGSLGTPSKRSNPHLRTALDQTPT